MALPVILIDSATGSDTQASGAGPSTALFGTTDASTDGAGTVVTLTAGTDLTNVATDGSHVIFLNDATDGNRNFGKITAKAGSGGATPNVTVSDAFGAGLAGKSWAIGGKRASLGSATSFKLVDNFFGPGDAMPGWTMQYASGSVDPIGATAGPNGDGVLRLRRDGDGTSGPITIQGEPNAATLPLVTFANDSSGFRLTNGTLWAVKDLEVRNVNASKTASRAFSINGFQTDQFMLVSGIKCSHATDKFLKFSDTTAGDCAIRIKDCYIANTVGVAIDHVGGASLEVVNCTIISAGSHAIAILASPFIVHQNIIYQAGGDGINVSGLSTRSRGFTLEFNTIDSSTGDGIEVSSADSNAQTSLTIRNNILSSNGGYGLKFSHASATDAFLAATAFLAQGNDTYNNTSGAYLSASGNYSNSNCPWATGDPGLDPTFTNAAGGDFSIGTNLKAKGYPLAGSLFVGTYSATYSYVDIGAAQRQEQGGGSTFVGIIGG